MKKIIVAMAILAATSAALAAGPAVQAPVGALDVTVGAGRNFGSDASQGSLAIGKQFQGFRGEASVGHVFTSGRHANVLGLNAFYPLGTVGPVNVSAKGGVSYYAVGGAQDGLALNAGLEAVYPVSKTLSVVSTLERVVAPSRIDGFNGNQFTVGLRSSF